MADMNNDAATAATPASNTSKLSLVLLGVTIAFVAEHAALMGVYRPWKYGFPSVGGATAAAVAVQPEHAQPTPGEAKVASSVLKLESFLVNLADPGKHRYVKATCQVGFDDKEAGPRIGEDPALLSATRQLILEVLATRVSDQIVSAEGKEEIRKEIRDKLNLLPLKAKVVDVYLTDLLVQY